MGPSNYSSKYTNQMYNIRNILNKLCIEGVSDLDTYSLRLILLPQNFIHRDTIDILYEPMSFFYDDLTKDH